jgi:hypothetical protein
LHKVINLPPTRLIIFLVIQTNRIFEGGNGDAEGAYSDYHREIDEEVKPSWMDPVQSKVGGRNVIAKEVERGNLEDIGDVHW